MSDPIEYFLRVGWEQHEKEYRGHWPRASHAVLFDSFVSNYRSEDLTRDEFISFLEGYGYVR